MKANKNGLKAFFSKVIKSINDPYQKEIRRRQQDAIMPWIAIGCFAAIALYITFRNIFG